MFYVLFIKSKNWNKKYLKICIILYGAQKNCTSWFPIPVCLKAYSWSCDDFPIQKIHMLNFMNSSLLMLLLPNIIVNKTNFAYFKDQQPAALVFSGSLENCSSWRCLLRKSCMTVWCDYWNRRMRRAMNVCVDCWQPLAKTSTTLKPR